MKNLFIVLVAVLGTSAMVSAQTTPSQTASAKEVKATKHHKSKADKKAKTEKSEAKAEATKMK
jgi:hypothetical protein